MMIFGVIACRAAGPSGGGGGGPGSGDDTVDSPPAGGQTVKSIRMNQPTNGDMVTLQGVIVTARVTSKKYGKVWVQDAGGGEYSGIQVFCNYGGTTPSCTMTQAQIDGLAIGAIVDVTGKFDSFLLSTAPAGAMPNLEIDSPTITATGQMGTPTTIDVPAATIARDQLASPAAEPYKGAYVHVTGGSAMVSSTTPMEFATTCTDKSTPAQTGTTYDGFETSGGGQTLAIGLGFYKTVTYCLPCTGVAMPYPCANPVTNQTFTSIAGIVEPEYNANGKVYLQLSPTVDADLAH
jgi:hypothetical protein